MYVGLHLLMCLLKMLIRIRFNTIPNNIIRKDSIRDDKI